MPIFDNNNPYGTYSQGGGQQQNYYAGQQQDFYQTDSYGYGTRSSLEGNIAAGNGASGSMNFGGNIQTVGPWWIAFTTGGIEGEPPLLEGALVWLVQRTRS